MPEDFIHLYSIQDGFKEIGKYGMKGRGPLEFHSPDITTVDGDFIYVKNMNRYEVARLKLTETGTSFIEEQRLSFEGQPKTDLMTEPRDAVHLSSGHYVAVSHNNGSEFFSLWNDSLKFISFFGESPIPEEVDMLQSMNYLQGKIRARDNRFVFVVTNLPYICMYEINDGKPVQKWAKYYMQPVYTAENGGILFDKDKTFGSSKGLFVSENYVYVLFLDVLMSEQSEKKAELSRGKMVLVFDHEGNNVARIDLDYRLFSSSIAVSSDEKKLYAITSDYHFIEYDLPEFGR